MDQHTKALAAYAAGLKFEDLDEAAIEKVKVMTLHTLAASLAAEPIPQTQAAIGMVRRKGGVPESTVWCGKGLKAPMDEAAFANGTIADILDWEDCSWIGHPSAGSIPTGLAVGEALGKTGRDYLTAVVAGLEVYLRIGMAIQPTREYLIDGHGWGLVSWQIFNSAVTAGRLKGFDTDQMQQLLGAAYHQTLCTVNKHHAGGAKSDIYHYVHGFNARNGINAALWVEAGFFNAKDTLDGPGGLWKQLSDTEDPGWYEKDLGTRFYITEVLQKHWPANMWIQGPLDALAELRAEYGLTMDNIEKIRVSPILEFLFEDYFASTRGPLDAQFSIPFCLSAYLKDPHPGPHWFSEENLNDPQIAAFCRRFEGFGPTVIAQDNFRIYMAGSFPDATVEVTMTDGRVVSRTVRFPKGHPKNPYTLAEEQEHFRMATKGFVTPEHQERIIELVSNLEQLDSLAELAALTAN